MLLCERCSTPNSDASRFCDACGAPLWLAGKSDQGMQAPNGGNSNGHSRSANSSAGLASALDDLTVVPSPLAEHNVHATLIIERGVSAGKKFPLSNLDANIGRWDADGGIFPDVDLDTDDPEAKVSRRHARISLRDGHYLIQDLGSTNGTFVNRGRRLAPGEGYPLNDGDEIIVGKTFLRFRVAR